MRLHYQHSDTTRDMIGQQEMMSKSQEVFFSLVKDRAGTKTLHVA